MQELVLLLARVQHVKRELERRGKLEQFAGVFVHDKEKTWECTDGRSGTITRPELGPRIAE